MYSYSSSNENVFSVLSPVHPFLIPCFLWSLLSTLSRSSGFCIWLLRALCKSVLLLSCSVMSNSLVTPRTEAHWVPLSMGCSRQEYWTGLPFPSPGYLPNPEIEPKSLALAGGFCTTGPLGKPLLYIYICIYIYIYKIDLALF